MDGLFKGIADFLGDNPWFTTFIVGFIVGYIVGKR